MYGWMPAWYQAIRYPLLLAQTSIGMLVFSWNLPQRSSHRGVFCEMTLLGMLLCWCENKLLRHNGAFLSILWVQCVILLSIFVFSILIEYCSFQISGWTAVSLASSGYAVQNIAGSIKTLLRMVPLIGALSANSIGVVLLDFFCYGIVYLLAGVVVYPHITGRKADLENKYKALFSALIMILCIGMGRISLWNADRTQISQCVENFYAILTGILILVLQFGLIEHRKISQDIDAMRQLLHEQYVQYENSKTNMQLVNEKYHDLKQLLQGFHGQVSSSQIQKLEKQLDGYEAVTNTGNEVLDVLLSDKRALCIQQDIQLTCYVGGAELGFVEELDLYSLFGNLLNNAIEAVSQLPPEQERFITLTARREDSMVTIHAENPCVGTVEFRDGLPKSHRDPNYHGFGMRSMERIAEKYGGSLVAKQVGDVFCLDIILFS